MMRNITVEEVEDTLMKNIKAIDITKMSIDNWKFIEISEELKTISLSIKGVEIEVGCQFEREVVKKRRFWFDKVKSYNKYYFGIDRKYGFIPEKLANEAFELLDSHNKMVNRNIVMKSLGNMI